MMDTTAFALRFEITKVDTDIAWIAADTAVSALEATLKPVSGIKTHVLEHDEERGVCGEILFNLEDVKSVQRRAKIAQLFEITVRLGVGNQKTSESLPRVTSEWVLESA